MNNIYIIDGLRTAIGCFDGALAQTTQVDMCKPIITSLLNNSGIASEDVDEVLLGNVLQAGLGQNIARQIAVHANIPEEKTALTVNMVCGSGLRAVCMAAQSIMCGDADLVIAGGSENMSQAPYLLPKARTGYRMGHGQIVDSMITDGLWDAFNDYHMGITAENLAEKYQISRDAQDEFAAQSQQKAQKAVETGMFADEIVPIAIPQRKGDPVVFAKDEYPRANITAESLSKLKPAFKKDGTVTAGNSSGINDGAALLLIASETMVQKYNLKPKAKIVSYAYAGTQPEIMGIGPAKAVEKALKKANWTLKDLDLIEANEAFAAQSIAVNTELGWNTDKINVNGGAIALGHPIGVSGARILVTLLHEMQHRKAEKGVATLCIGGGMGIAVCMKLA